MPEGRLPLLVKSRIGYQNLCRLVTNMKLHAAKGGGQTTLAEMEELSAGTVCLTGGLNGPLKTYLERSDEEALQFLQELKRIWGAGNVFVEIQRHSSRSQEAFNRALTDMASRVDLPLLATNGVRYAKKSGRLLHDVLTCIRHGTDLDQAGRLLNRNAESRLKNPVEMESIFADLPEALSNSIGLAERLDFTLKDLGYHFPDYPVPPGETMISYLRKLTHAGARERYRPYSKKARRQIEYELGMIEKLELAGYFLIVWDIVQFCQRQDILVQGRGSAANSAVCYSLGITAVDPVGMELLFERFLSEERGEWPDIDLDLPSGERREQVIQYVYEHYGQRGAAMTANVITYRSRSAAREVGKAFGFPVDTLDRLSRVLTTWGWSGDEKESVFLQRFQDAGLDLSAHRVKKFVRLWREIQDLPRHLGQHSGGMIICRGHLDSIVPLENARMPGRTVVQWDKEDCADLGLIKVDLLGLGMMSALHESLELIRKSGGELDLAHLPQNDSKVYSMLQKADTIGVFQVESRAQMATLPRLKPRCFYDLVVEVAIIRPGPIVGEMVHPYLRRRSGLEPVTYPHPSLEPILKRTLGVPLFQEQLLRIAMVAAGFSGGEAEELRRALGFKKPDGAMKKIEEKLRWGLEEKGIHGEAAEKIIRHITSFALYGFPESHAASFALLAYASAYVKAHYPAQFYAALLNNQPMGFYHPATLVKDAQHRKIRVRPIDANRSDWNCTIEKDGSLRLGLRYVKGLKKQAGCSIEQERRRQTFASMDDLCQRVELTKSELTTLAEIGALNSFGMRRREALWQVEKTWRSGGPLFPNVTSPQDDSPLDDMTEVERMMSDYANTGMTIGHHPMALVRKELADQGVQSAQSLQKLRHGCRVITAGSVIVRQRPMTAKGFLFLSLEDETGVSNIVVRPQMFSKHRLTLLSQPFLRVEGILQNQDNVVAVRAHKVEPFNGLPTKVPSHDFH
jgi:error-prone DNA polymerase